MIRKYFQISQVGETLDIKWCDSKGAFSRAIFLWQRLIVTETLAKYLRSHTATIGLKEKLSKNLC